MYQRRVRAAPSKHRPWDKEPLAWAKGGINGSKDTGWF